MLIMRARPPPTHDFIAVFQKFKLAINLLVSRVDITYISLSNVLEPVAKRKDLIVAAVN